MSPATPTAEPGSRTKPGSRAKPGSRILVAGADAEQRAAVRHDLSEALPASTQIGEAGAVWEVLEQAPSSSVVMLTGDLGEVSAESLMHELGSRYPSLPVVALGLACSGGPRAVATAFGW
jgi:hypothetical protein